MPNQTLGASNLIYENQNTPSTASGQPVDWRGQSMLTPTVVPLLPGLAFEARGLGRFSLSESIFPPGWVHQGSRVSGRQGSTDILMQVGTAGSAQTVCYLTGNPSNPTTFIVVGVDDSNRPLIQVTNNVAAVVAEVTPSAAAAIPAGTVVAVRFAWDSLNLIGSRMASLTVNRAAIPDGDWSTDPVAAWTYFEPSHLVLGLGLGGADDFAGSVLAVQVSNTVNP